MLAPGGGPPAVIPYPPVDVKAVLLGVRDNYFYIRIEFNGVIPSQTQLVEGNEVTGMGFNLMMNTDNDENTGGLWGMEDSFGMTVKFDRDYDQFEAAVGFDFQSSDAHSNAQILSGETGNGGPGFNYADIRFDINALGTEFFPRDTTVFVRTWSEAESDLWHHFAYDEVPDDYFYIN